MTAPIACSPEREKVHDLCTANLSALFWRPGWIGIGSPWYCHIPFAHWMVATIKPRTLVELGTHTGVSYSAFCEAVVHAELDTRCYSVGTWRSDNQTGPRGVECYVDFQRFHDSRYGAFSELMRCGFDDVLLQVPDTSIDLLHVDGLQTYQAVKHHFESWRPKLSESAVVLFHNTNLPESQFGILRFWEEVRAQYPSFEFLHGHGLGVLAAGRSILREVADLCSLHDSESVRTIRERFSVMGERWTLESREQVQREEVVARDSSIRALEAEVRRLKAASIGTSIAEAHLRARAAQRSAQARRENANAAAGLVRLESPSSMARSKIRVVYISVDPYIPGNLYRVARYAEAASAAGAEASWIALEDVPKHTQDFFETDLLVIWRVAWDERVARAVEAARRGGARIIFDIDDLLIDPALVSVDVIDGIRTTAPSESAFQDHCAGLHTTMMAADCCTAPTEELAAKMRQFFLPAVVLPNGFDRETYRLSRQAARRRRSEKPDRLVRIGYAGGTRSHQRDFAVAADAIARVLRERPDCRLVLFRSRPAESRILPVLDIEEFPSFQGLEDRIEWQNIVPVLQLPELIGSFDINIAPLEVGNVFCEAKSELKFFEAALVDVPTVASPTGPYRRAIRDEVTGFLAASSEDWYRILLRLVDDTALRRRVARSAHNDVIWRFGPFRRAETLFSALPLLCGKGRAAAHGFALELHRQLFSKFSDVHVSETEIVFEADGFGAADVSVVVSLRNDAESVDDVLNSVEEQSLETLDLIVVDDASTDGSLLAAVEWAQRHATRFNRVAVLRNRSYSGLSLTRNAGFDAADSLFVMLLNADCRLLPECCAVCLSAVLDGGAAFAYPEVRQFGGASDLHRNRALELGRLIGGSCPGPVALLSKEVWAGVGGYRDLASGNDDLDLWCRLAEHGLWGIRAGDIPLVESHVRDCATASRSHHATPVLAEMERQHPWLDIVGKVDSAGKEIDDDF
jgi:glycosyltransferase involved in cell wall biosynthesis